MDDNTRKCTKMYAFLTHYLVDKCQCKRVKTHRFECAGASENDTVHLVPFSYLLTHRCGWDLTAKLPCVKHLGGVFSREKLFIVAVL